MKLKEFPDIDTSKFKIDENGNVLRNKRMSDEELEKKAEMWLKANTRQVVTETEQKLIDIIHSLTKKLEATEQPDKSAYKHLVRENEKLRGMVRDQSEQISIMERQAKERPSAMSIITENNRFRERIVDLELEIHSLKKELESKEKQITNMQCCQNCANYNFEGATVCDFIHDCKEYDHWKLRPTNC